MKTLKGFQQQYQLHGIDWLKFTCNSIDQWRMRLENVVQESGGHTELLIWRQSHPITYISIVIDTLFINRKLNTIKWL